jgi:ATP-dependent protease ClpP protease subunit
MTDYFNKLTDNDFFSDKLTHIYFNGKVEDKSVDKLVEDVREANKIKEENNVKIQPKPILIHINSTGGSIYDGMRFLSIFKISSVPIATIIDNYSFSAATFLSIHSPYRVMTKNSFCLLHYYSYSGLIKFNREKLFSRINEFERYFSNIIDMYLEKTNFKKDELNELLQHDLYLNYKYCLEKRIVDRIIDFEIPSKKKLKINIYNIIKDDKTININLLPCSNDNISLDTIIRKNNENTSNTYLIYPIHNVCDEENLKKTYKKLPEKNPEKIPEKISNEEKTGDIFHTLNLTNRIKAINGIKIAIIDVPISIDNILPLLYTNRIYMYNHSFIICNLLYFNHHINNILIEDTFKNYNTIFNQIKTILKQKTKMSLNEISNINKKYIIINPKEAIKLGLCHEIIYS